jgi:Glyoxalase-like domain
VKAAANVAFDHLVVGATTLREGEDYIESLTGVRPQRGGKHVAMGTHNSLLRLGPRTYLEIIAIDPDGITPDRPRWFDLDKASMRSRLAIVPQLIHWVASTSDIEQSRRASAVDPGDAYPMSRGPFQWRITIPDDGHLPGDGVFPTLIEWSDNKHPAEALEKTGISVATLAGAHPDPGKIRAALHALGLNGTMPVTYAEAPRVAAMLRTHQGTVTL